jgi:hypothetical protein
MIKSLGNRLGLVDSQLQPFLLRDCQINQAPKLQQFNRRVSICYTNRSVLAKSPFPLNTRIILQIIQISTRFMQLP